MSVCHLYGDGSELNYKAKARNNTCIKWIVAVSAAHFGGITAVTAEKNVVDDIVPGDDHAWLYAKHGFASQMGSYV